MAENDVDRDSPTWEAEQELRHAQLQEEYHAALDAVHAAPDDQDAKVRKDELAEQIVAVRQELRQQREAQAAALSDGEGVARPAPVEGDSGVNQ